MVEGAIKNLVDQRNNVHTTVAEIGCRRCERRLQQG